MSRTAAMSASFAGRTTSAWRPSDRPAPDGRGPARPDDKLTGRARASAWPSPPARPRSPSPRCDWRPRRAWRGRRPSPRSGRAPVEPVHHLVARPEILLQVLHPFEIADDDAAGVAQDVGDDEDPVVALGENPVGLGRGRAVRAFGDDAAAQAARRSASITRSTAQGASTSQRCSRRARGSIVASLE